MDAKLSELTTIIRKFIEERDWDQFHDPKDLAISLNLEASEVLEHFQWKSKTQVNKAEVSKELADVLYWVLLMSSNLDINLGGVFKEKMRENAKKYPVSKAKGSSKKYTEL
jgi:NTP pyrophosphatase (non-canonical NTP hydrolase)